MATVLVVDDEPDIVLLAQMALEHHGYDVRAAGGGEEAIVDMTAARPDAVVLDLMMPGVDGWDVVQWLKAAPDAALREVPVILLTALSAPVDRARGGIEGAVRYVTKPFDPDELARTVADVLAGEPEPVQRREAQHRALELLARLEKDTAVSAGGVPPGATPGAAPARAGPAGRLRLSGLERAPRADRRHTPRPGVDVGAVLDRLAFLTPVQRRTLDVVHRADTVQAAAAELGVSRSNVYASLRRIARRLDVESAQDLLEVVRADARFALR